MTLDGDIGARHLIMRQGEAVVEMLVKSHGALLDIDTPQALEDARRGGDGRLGVPALHLK